MGASRNELQRKEVVVSGMLQIGGGCSGGGGRAGKGVAVPVPCLWNDWAQLPGFPSLHVSSGTGLMSGTPFPELQTVRTALLARSGNSHQTRLPVRTRIPAAAKENTR